MKSAIRKECPRCGDVGLEFFSTHAWCAGCNYEEIYDHKELGSIPQWAEKAIKSATAGMRKFVGKRKLIGAV